MTAAGAKRGEYRGRRWKKDRETNEEDGSRRRKKPEEGLGLGRRREDGGRMRGKRMRKRGEEEEKAGRRRTKMEEEGRRRNVFGVSRNPSDSF